MGDAPSILHLIADNIARLQERIASAADRAGRSATAIRMVAVTKYVDARAARIVFEQGISDLGESRPQSFWDKAEQLADLEVSWHLVGHLQRNKVSKCVAYRPTIHSVDSLRLLSAIGAAAASRVRQDRDQGAGESAKLGDDEGALQDNAQVLIEFNTSGDKAKHGFRPGDLGAVADAIGASSNIDVLGLMTMASLGGGPEVARSNFALLRKLRDELRERVDDPACLRELSMGMSGDFDVAIEEGATILRIGSALFQGIPRGD